MASSTSKSLTMEELNEMTVRSLKIKAKEEGVVNYSKMLKADLIEALSASIAAPTAKAKPAPTAKAKKVVVVSKSASKPAASSAKAPKAKAAKAAAKPAPKAVAKSSLSATRMAYAKATGALLKNPTPVVKKVVKVSKSAKSKTSKPPTPTGSSPPKKKIVWWYDFSDVKVYHERGEYYQEWVPVKTKLGGKIEKAWQEWNEKGKPPNFNKKVAHYRVAFDPDPTKPGARMTISGEQRYPDVNRKFTAELYRTRKSLSWTYDPSQVKRLEA